MANTFMTNVPDAFTLEYLGQELTKLFSRKATSSQQHCPEQTTYVFVSKKTVAGSIYS